MVKESISIFLSVALISFITSPSYVRELKPVKDLERVQTIQKLKNLSNGKLKLSEDDGQVFLAGKLSSKQIVGEKSATKFLEENKLLFGIDSATSDLKALEVNKDDTGDTYIKYQQVIKGIKVNNSSIKVHFDKDGVVASVNGKLEENKTITTIGNKTLSEKEAVEIAQNKYSYKKLRNTPKTEKLIVMKDNKNYEVFKVNISYTQPTIANYDVFVEAHSGEIIQTENNIRFDGVAEGSGTDVNGNIKNLNLYLNGASYQMKDVTRLGVTSSINTYSLNHGTYNGTLVSNNTNLFNDEDHKASVSAHYNAGKVLDFYKGLFDRNSLDDNGMAVESYTHYGYSYNNAFWDGYEMVYGDGDGSTFTYLSGDLDVVGHEMTHGVISNTANLQYHNQPGALNESMADVFGVLISTYDKYNVALGQNWTFNAADWVVGDDIYTPNVSGDALRSLSNPTLYGQPDNMGDYQNYSDNEYGDWGGVHTNSGIVNKAAYLMAKSIGMEKTAKIYYRALVNYMSEYTNFEDAENCLLQSASDLYSASSAEVATVNSVFNSVGVGQTAVEDPVSVTGISLDKTTANLKVGEVTTLVARVNPTDAANKNVTWASSNALVASVDSVGKVSAVGVGVATITAKTQDGGYSASCSMISNKLTVTFNSQGGSTVASKTANYNSTIAAPTAPKKAGYTFGGWYKETGCSNTWNFTTAKVISNTMLYAKWVVVAPGIPANFKASSSSYNSINTTWSTVVGANGYEVYRATSSAGAYTLVSRTAATSYNNTGLITNRNYYYKIRAYRTIGSVKVYSGYSIVISSKPIPSVPIKVKYTKISSKSIKLTWNGVTGANGYEVYKDTKRTGSYGLLIRTTNLYYTNSGLIAGKNYYYKTRAYRIVGVTRVYSNWSAVVHVN